MWDADTTSPCRATLTFTASTWNTVQTVTTAGQDDDAASDAAVTLTHTANGGGYVDVQETVTVTIVEKDTSVLSVDNAEAAEDGGNVSFTVSISAASGSAVTVDYATSDGTAAAGQDYTETGGTLTFPALVADSQTILVPIIDDADDEAEQETLTLTLSNVQGASLAQGGATLTATGTITDDDDPAVTASFKQSSYSVNEGGTVEVTVTLSADPEREVTVQLTHDPQGGTGSEDYSGVPGSLVFQKGDTEKSFTFSATADNIDDDDESVVLGFGTMPDGVTAGTTATVTITDDDDPAVTASFGQSTYSVAEGSTVEVTVTLSADPEREVTVQLTHDPQGTTGSGDYSGVPGSLVFQKGDTEKSFTFSATDDDIDDDDKSVALGFGTMPDGVTAGTTATVTITDDDDAGVSLSKTALSIDEGASDTYTVVLDTQPTTNVTVAIAGRADTDITLSGETLTNDTLTFTSENWDTAQTVRVTAAQDDDAASDAVVTLTHTVSGTGEYAGVSAGSVTVTIVEKDTSVLSVDNAEAAEDGGNMAFTVSISAASGSAVTVDYATSDGTAAAGQDYTETGGTLTFPALVADSQTILVPIIDDADDEAEEETFTLTLSNAQGASLAGSASTLAVTGTITDDDDPAVTASFKQAAYSVAEGSTVEVTVTLSADPEREVTVQLTHDPQGGAGSADYSGVPGSLVFQKGDTEKSFTFSATADNIDDDDESVVLGFGTMPDGVTAGTTATVSITDDDDPAVTASFGQSTYSVAEGGTVEVTVTLSADPEREVTLLLTHVPQGNTGSADYSGVPENLVFQKGDTEKSFTFSAAADDIDDDGESVALAFGTLPDRVTAGTTATVTITDDDTAGVTVSKPALNIDEGGNDTYTVVLDTEPTASVTVAVAGHAGTDISLDKTSLTFTVGNWDTAQTVTVSAAQDDDAASDAAVNLTHTVSGTGEYAGVSAGNVTVTIVEKDASVLSISNAEAGEAGGNVVFTVSISAAAGQEVTVDYATSGGTATAGQDYTETTGTLTFAANSVASQTVSVPVTDDAVDEEEEETFTLTLSSAQGASLAGGASTLAVTGTITDDDDPAVTANFGQASYNVAEGGTVEVTVTLSADPEREVTILLSHDPQGGAGPADYSGVPENLVFQKGDTEKSFTFSATDDEIDDDGESVALGFGTMPDRVTAGTTATITITDNDAAGVTISESALSIEEGASDTYTVVLDTQPTTNVTVAIAGRADTDITLSGDTLTNDTLTFTPDTWDTAQTVTVSAAQDDDAASDAAVILTHSVSGGGYDDVTAGSITVTIVEKDAASPSLELSLPAPANNDADNSGDVTLNDVLTYTATATNDGNVPLSGVTLNDLLVDEDGHVCGSLDIGEQCQLTGTHTVVQTEVDAGVVANTVTAEATELTTAVTASQQTPVAQESTLTLTKTTTTVGFTSVGDTISYSYEATNGGTVTLSGTLAISDDKIGSSDITCEAVPGGGLAPSASVTCSGTYTVVQADLDADGVTNKASASLDGVTSNEATATVPWKAPQASIEPQVSIELAVQVTEDAGTAEVAVSLSESSLQTVTVDYATSDGTATAGTDYVASSSTLTFAPGITEQKIRVTVINDAVDEEEENETFTITLTGPNNASLDASSGTVTITDDDDPSVTVSFGQASYSVAEGGTVEVTVTLSADPEREVTVLLTHDPQGNTGSADYSGVPGSLVFQIGDTEKSFTFSATADDIDDDGESVALGFGTMPDDVTAGTTATVSITDDDTAGVTVSETALSIDEGGSASYTVVLDTQPTDDVTVTVNDPSNTDITASPAVLTLTPSDWDDEQTVTVTAGQDADPVDDTATITHTVASDNDSKYDGISAGDVAVTVDDDETQDRELTLTMPVPVHGDTDGDGGINLGDTLAYTATATNSGNVTLEDVNVQDLLTDTSGNDCASLAVGGTCVLTGTYSVTQANVDAGKVTNIATATATGAATKTVTRETGVDQVQGLTLEKTTTDSGFDEAGDELDYSYKVTNSGTVTLTGTLEIDDDRMASADITCPTVPATGLALRAFLTCTGSYTVTQADVDEGEVENTATASLGGATSAQDTVTVSWRAPLGSVPALSIGSGSVQEDGGSISLPVALSPSSLQTVTVDYDTANDSAAAGADYTASSGTLTFAPGDTGKTVTVVITDDDIDEGNETFKVNLTNPSNANITPGSETGAVTIQDDDTAGVTVSETSLTIGEGSTGTYTVVLTSQPASEVTVTIAGHSETDITLSGETLTNDALTFTASTWDTAQTVTVTAGEDNDAASDAAVTLTHTANGGGYVAVQETVTVTIVEKDAAVLSVEDAEAAEDGGNVVFTVSISAAAGEEVTVDYATSDVTATKGQDYTETTGTLTFPANSVANQTILVPVTDDAVDEEEEETLTLTLSNVQGASLAQGGATLTATGTITDDDDPAVTASFKQSSYSVNEGGTVEVTVTLSADPEREVTVLLTHVPQGDTGSADYSGVPGSLVFQIGDTEKSFTFSATDDEIDDDGESVALGFGTMPDRVTAGTTATVSITDDDAAGVTVSKTALNIDEGENDSYTVVLDTEPTDDVTVAVAGHSGTDISLDQTSLTFTASTWDTAQTVTVTAGEDNDAASDAAVTLTHTANGGGYVAVQETVTVTIVEKDAAVLSVSNAEAAEDGGNVVFTVSISAASGSAVTVDYATSGVTATAGQDYTETTGTLTFAANSVASKTVSVPVTDDEVDEEEEETFTLTLSNAQGASLAQGGETLTVTGTITDDDDPSVTANFGQASYSVAEGGTVEVTVTLSADPEREVTVLLTHVPQGDTGSADYSGVPGSLVFQIGDTEKSFTFSATDDEIDDDGESVALGFGTLPDRMTAGTTATVTITDDDQRGVTIAPTSFTVLAGQSNKYSVVLNSQPTGGVTVTVSGQSGTDLTVSPVSLTFTASNWNTAREVTVAADNNASRASVTLTHTANGGDYVDVQETVTVTIIGQPQDLVIQVGVTASQQEMAVSEGGSNTYSLVLSSAPTGDVTISVNVPTGNDLAASPASLTFTSENWDTMQTVTVSAAEDDDAIVDDAVDIGHTVSGLGDAEIPGVRVTIMENDTPDVTVAPTELTIGEGGTGQYTVVLDTLPSDNVTVNIAVPSGTDLSVSPSGPLTFTTATWSQAQVVTVTAAEDDDADTDPAVTLTHTVTGGDYEGQNAAGVTVSITEDDYSVSFSASDYTATEGGDDAQVTVLLNAPAPSSIDIPLTTEGMDGATSDDWSGVPEEVTFNTGDTSRTFTVTATDDEVEDNNEMVALGFGDLPDSVVRGTPDKATVTLMNDDGNGPGTEPLTTAMTCGPDNTWSGEITQPGQMDHWYWHLDGNDKYSGPADHGIVGYAVNMMGVGSGEGTLQDPHIFRIQGLYDGTPLSPLGGTIPSWWGNDRGKGWDSLVSHDIQHTGVYQATVGANPFGAAANGTGTYKICVMGPGPFRLEEPPERRLVVQPDLYMTGEGRDTYTVGLSAAPEEIATVWVDPVFNSTSEHFSVTPKRMIFTADDWDTPQVVTITRKASAPAYIDDSGFLIEHDTSGYDYFGAGTMAYFHTWKSSVDEHLKRRKPLSERNNSLSMGEPDISGTAQVGQTLTATTADILDVDGLTGVVYGYQWYRHDFATGLEDPIEGATGSSYTLTAADACMGIVVGVIFTDDAGYRQGLSSFPVPVPPQGQADCANNPAMGEPDISGTAQVGETLTAGTYGIWDVDGMIGVDFAYRWVRHDFDAAEDTSIAGATGASYTVTPDDEGKGIKVQVSFTDDAGNEESLTSASTTAVAAAPPPTPDNVRAVTKKSGAVELTWEAPDDATVTGYRIERRRTGGQGSGPQRSHGQPRDHHTLVEDTGSADTGYTDESAEKGLEYEYRVSARNEAGPGRGSGWVRAGPASASNSPATGAPTIIGTAQVGETLTADITGIADADGLSGETFTYQWVSGDGTTDTDIENATGSTYTLVAADQGRSVKVRVTFTDDGGNEETLASAPTAPVWADGPPGAPRNLAATPGNKEVTLSWEPPADNGNAPAARYRIEWRIDGKDYDKNHWGTARSTSYTTTDQANLANGVKYFFRVKAGNGSGNSYGPYGPASEEVSATPTSGSAVDLSTPVLSDTENLHHRMVRLDWQDIEDAGWYVVQYYNIDGGSGEWLDLPAEGVDIAFHGSSAVVSNMDYGIHWLRVGAASCAGESEWSQIEELIGTKASDWEGVPVPEVEQGDEIEPCPVVLGTPVLSESKNLHHAMVRLDWQDIEDASWYVVQYYHIDGGGGEWLDLPAVGVNIAFHGSSAVVSNLDYGIHWLRVGAASCAGSSEWSQIEELIGTRASDWEGVPVPEVAEGDEIEPCSEDADTSDNSPATGAPTISGTAQVGETLTANTSGVADEDGFTNGAFTYQWVADDVDISGATGSTYTLTDSEEGKVIKVRVSFTDDAGNGETLTSAATDAVAAAPQTNSPATGAPIISGTVQVEETLTANTSGIADADGLGNVQYEYQWLADDSEIAGATGSTYTLVAADEGKAIKVEVTFIDDAGNDESLTSAATDAVAAEPTPNSPATGAPTITGTAQVGETLTADASGIADADGLANATFSYQWLADDTDIAGASGLTYTLTDSEESKAITVQVSFTDDADNEETLTSAATAAVAAAPTPNSPATGAPTITGTVQVGETLTADTSDIADTDGLSNVQYEYQWLADDADISGATNATYTLAETDEGKTIKVRASFADDLGNDEELTSAATDAVAAQPTPNTPATGAPTIDGTAQVGETLTANTSGIADEDGLSNVQYEYQWLADDAEISGATGSTYTLADTDEGKAIKLEVTFTDDADNEETLTSGATEAVAAAEPAEPPAKPRGLEATATHDQVVLTWDDPQDDSITGYVVLRRIPGVDPEGHFDELVADTGSAAATYTDDTVAAGTSYTYRIKAINGAGSSERSRWYHIDTPAAP